MSKTSDTTEEVRRQSGTEARAVAGMIRRMAVKLTSGAFWQLLGHLLLDSRTPESFTAEVFGNIGFHSRPKAGANSEAIVAFIGGAQNPVIVGTRDEDGRRAMANDMDDDETAIFNRTATVRVRKNTTVEIRAAGPVESTLRGQTYRGSEDQLIDSLKFLADAIGTYAVAIKPVADPSNAATPALVAAVAQFDVAVAAFQSGSSGYLTTVAKVE